MVSPLFIIIASPLLLFYISICTDLNIFFDGITLLILYFVVGCFASASALIIILIISRLKMSYVLFLFNVSYESTISQKLEAIFKYFIQVYLILSLCSLMFVFMFGYGVHLINYLDDVFSKREASHFPVLSWDDAAQLFKGMSCSYLSPPLAFLWKYFGFVDHCPAFYPSRWASISQYVSLIGSTVLSGAMLALTVNLFIRLRLPNFVRRQLKMKMVEKN